MTPRIRHRSDRFGIGWRPEIAAELLENLHEFDVLEIMVEHFAAASPAAINALASLRAHVGLVLHGVSLGLASCQPVRPALVAKMAALFRKLKPDYWSEHLAFVRGGGFELNALAAPPRNRLTVAATVANIRRASKIVGARPLLENAASVLEPPGSDRDQLTWLLEVISAADCDLLLDLHNLFGNSVNSGFDAAEFLARLPPDRIAAIHLAGGRWFGPPERPIRLDTHTDPIPPEVFDLLEQVGARASRPLTVIVEWDGNYPPMSSLLAELERAKSALSRGRARRSGGAVPRSKAEAIALEGALATLYASPRSQRRIPAALTRGLSRSLVDALHQLDPIRIRLVSEVAKPTRASTKAKRPVK